MSKLGEQWYIVDDIPLGLGFRPRSFGMKPLPWIVLLHGGLVVVDVVGLWITGISDL
jgi:hypothetical protein